MHKYYTDKDLYQTHCREVTKNVEGYSWEQVADQFLEIINQVSPVETPTIVSPISDKVNKYIFSLTTIPSRLNHIEDTIISLINQTLKPEKIILNIPEKYGLRFKSTLDETSINKIKEIKEK